VDPLRLPRTAAATALGVATAVRGSRVFHPHGSTRTCTVTVEPGAGAGASWGSRLLDEPAAHDGVVRLSRGVGLPEPLPDVEGLALRLPGLGVGGAPLDLLVNSAWRFAFAPAALSRTWSTVLPYRTGSGASVLLGARPERDGFRLLAARLLGPWTAWGRLDLGEPVDGEDLRFTPTVGAPDLVPTPLFRSLRARSYVASQSAR
jgi:hypothetical protein